MDISEETVKRAICEHGAVASGIYMAVLYFNYDNGAYYCPEEEGNHAVVIVGWDDNYSRMNFNERYRPEHDGSYATAGGTVKDYAHNYQYDCSSDRNIGGCGMPAY